MSIYKQQSNNTEIDLKEIFSILLDNIKFIIMFVLIMTSITAAITLMLDNIYRSSAALSIVGDKDSSISSLVGGNSGLLGSLSGNMIPNLGGNDQNALSILTSRDFFKTLYYSDNFLVHLMATKDYDPVSGITSIDKKKYDKQNLKWVRKVSHPFKVKPSLQEAHKFFLESLNIMEDDSKNIIIISFDHKSAVVANDFLHLIITGVNEYIRQNKINQAEKGIDFIKGKLRDEKITEIRNVLANVMESDIQTLSLAEKSKEFIFETIDSPFVPERKLKPKRTIICITIAFLSFVLSCFFIIILNSYNRTLYFKYLLPNISKM